MINTNEDENIIKLKQKNQQLIDSLIEINKQLERQPLLLRIKDWINSYKTLGLIQYYIIVVLFNIVLCYTTIAIMNYTAIITTIEYTKALFAMCYIYIIYNINWKKKDKLI